MRTVRALVASILTSSAGAQTVVVEAPRILTSAAAGAPTSAELQPGAMLLRNGKVVQIGRVVGVPQDALVIRLPAGSVVTPGFIDAGSSIELSGDRAAFSLDMDLTRAVADAPSSVRALLRQGVTTTLLRSPTTDNNGSRTVALKTAGSRRDQRVVSALAAIRFPVPEDADPLLFPDRLRGRLSAGKAYTEKWLKYFSDLAEWEKAQEEGRKVQAAAEKPAEKPTTPPAADDPLSGTWELTAEGGRRGPTTQTLRLRLQGRKVDGSLEGGGGGRPGGGGGGARPVSGTFQGNKLELDTEGGDQFGMHISAEVSGETMAGNMRVGDRFDRPFTGKRIEKGSSATPIVVRRRRASADGRPLPPPMQDELEPYRALFAQQIPLVLEVSSEWAARPLLPLCLEEFKVPVVLATSDARVMGMSLPTAEAGFRGWVLESPGLLADEAAFERWPTGAPQRAFALQTNPAGSGISLLSDLNRAVHRGLSPADALSALTSGPSTLFGLTEIGSLEPGKQADFVVFDGEPFEARSRVLRVFVSGEERALDAEFVAAVPAQAEPAGGRNRRGQN